jgi:hypothetical protein
LNAAKNAAGGAADATQRAGADASLLAKGRAQTAGDKLAAAAEHAQQAAADVAAAAHDMVIGPEGDHSCHCAVVLLFNYSGSLLLDMRQGQTCRIYTLCDC